MQWHVHGTDVATGRPVTLAVEQPQAYDAVRAAMSKQILVKHVTAARRTRRPRVWLAAVVLAALCSGLAWKVQSQEKMLPENHIHQASPAAARADDHATLRTPQPQMESLEHARDRELVDVQRELEAVRKQRAATEQQLASARDRVTDLEGKVTSAASLKAATAAAQQQTRTLKEQLQAQDARLRELQAQAATAAALAKSNHEFADQVEQLKSQLLVLAAQAPKQPEPVQAAPREMAAAARKAMPAGYEAISRFMLLHFPCENLTIKPSDGGTVITTSLWPENAATLCFVHDVAKERAYSATLTISLASDGPKAKLAENFKLVRDFLQTAAPSVDKVDAWIAEAVRNVAAKPESYRELRLGRDYKLTMWNNAAGVYTWKVQPRDEGD